MSVSKIYNAHFFRHKVSFPSERCNAIIVCTSTLRLFFSKCWLWHIPNVTKCSAGPGWQLFYLISRKQQQVQYTEAEQLATKSFRWPNTKNLQAIALDIGQSLVGIQTVPISFNGPAIGNGWRQLSFIPSQKNRSCGFIQDCGAAALKTRARP